MDKAKADLVGNPELVSRGFVYEMKNKRLLEQAAVLLRKTIQGKKIITDSKVIRNTAVDFLERYFFDQTGRRPMILPVILEV